MKKIIHVFGFVFLALFALAAFSLPLAAQTESGPSIEPTTMEAILVLIAGGLVTTITGLLKGVLKLTGAGAVILTGAVAVVATAAYFLFIAPPFDVLKFLIYAAAAFGEATGYYHLYRRATS